MDYHNENNFSPTAPPPPYDLVCERRRSRPHSENPMYPNIHDLPESTPLFEYVQTGCRELKKPYCFLALVFTVVLAVVCLTTFYVTVAFGKLEQYGQKCDHTVPMSCGTTELICLNNDVCGCKSSDYKWDQQQSVCTALVNTNAECRKWGWDGSYAIPCTENAVCNDMHRCECLPYYVEVENECIASYDAICKSSRDCNQQEFLVCGDNSKCKCRPGTVRHQKANKIGCFVKIGETCAENMRDQCIDPNAECTTEQICRCNKDKGYVPSEDNTSCGKSFNQTCNVDNDCAETLTCMKTFDVTGLCLCRDNEIFKEDEQKCHIKAGQLCNVSGLKKCVEHASCHHSTCVCNEGWGLDEASGLCFGTEGTVCSTDENCLVSLYFECIEGRCGCDQKHTNFNRKSRSCFGNTTSTVCVSDLNCDQRRMVCDQKTKTCACSLGFEEDKSFCYGTYGTSCAKTSDCNSPQHLSCLEGKCGCDSATEEWDDDQCKLQSYQRCADPQKRFDMKCVGNLTCMVDPAHKNDVFKLCECEPNYVLSDDKRLCINSAITVHSCSLFPIVAMFITAKFLY